MDLVRDNLGGAVAFLRGEGYPGLALGYLAVVNRERDENWAAAQEVRQMERLPSEKENESQKNHVPLSIHLK
jgi:hypothetical protein